MHTDREHRSGKFTHAFIPICIIFGNILSWNYFDDLDCTQLTNSVSWSFAVHSADGLGSNCQTVEITKTGSYSKDSDECSLDEEVQSDYASIEYVINECIQTEEKESVMLLCDDEKLYFNTYSNSLQCDGDVEMSVYHYFDADDCYDIQCNAAADSVVIAKEEEVAIDDGEKVKEYIHKSMMMMMDKRDIVMTTTPAKSHEIMMQWVNYIIVGVVVCIALVVIYCQHWKNSKNESYMQIK